jgi:hypothetical protein
MIRKSSFVRLLFALVSSCGAAESQDDGEERGLAPAESQGGSTDTVGVPEKTPSAQDGARAAAVGPRPRRIRPVLPFEPPASTELAGFAAGHRFVVYDGPERTVVLDREAGESFAVYGHPLREAGGFIRTWEAEGGFTTETSKPTTTVKTDAPDTRPGGQMVVRTPNGVQVVDLANRGALVTGWAGEPVSADLSPDGASLAVVTQSSVELVRLPDGARWTYPGAPSDPEGVRYLGRGGSAVWSTESEIVIVDPAAWRAVRLPRQGTPSIVAADDGSAIAILQDTHDTLGSGSVAVLVPGEARPRAVIAAAHASGLRVSPEGAKVAWTEESGTDDGVIFIHTLDVASGAHARFIGQGARCMVAPEFIVGLNRDEVITDGSCSVGCPSVRWSHVTLRYDATTGAQLGKTQWEEEMSWNELVAARTAVAEDGASRLAIPLTAMIGQPKSERVLVEREPSSFALADLAEGRVLVTFAGSDGVALEAVQFSPDGELLAGVADGRPVGWDVASGGRLW